MAIRIVTIGKSNAHLLATVAREVFDHPVDGARLAAYVDQPQHLLCVALRDGLVVGQTRAIVHSHPDKAPTSISTTWGSRRRISGRDSRHGFSPRLSGWAESGAAESFGPVPSGTTKPPAPSTARSAGGCR